MFALRKPKLPITADQRQWVDASFRRLADLVGAEQFLRGPIVLPTPEFFPDPYDKNSDESVRLIYGRVSHLMGMSPDGVDIYMFDSDQALSKDLVPFWSGKSSDAGGLYFHEPAERPHIAISRAQLKNPAALVATIAHELGHVILLRPGIVQRDEPDMEPLNDLLTVFLGFGIFTANSAFRFEQYSSDRSQGWSTSRLGYLSEEIFGYALARYALERGESKPGWRSFLAMNISTYMKRSAAWLEANRMPKLIS